MSLDRPANTPAFILSAAGAGLLLALGLLGHILMSDVSEAAAPPPMAQAHP